MGTNNFSKGDVVARAKELIAGATKLGTGTTPVALVGSAFSTAEILSKLLAVVRLRQEVEAAQATVRAKLVAEAAELPALRAFMSALHAHVKVAHGTDPEALAAFGIHPKARTPLTVEQQVMATAKRNATRLARHTMGSRQKAEIKGTVTGVLIAPVTAAPPTEIP